MSKFIELKSFGNQEAICLVHVEHIVHVTPMQQGCWIILRDKEEFRCSNDYNDVKKFLTSS